MSEPKKSTEEDDVMEFLNSLPESHKNESSLNAKSNTNKDEDILGFLDELAAQSKPSTPAPTDLKEDTELNEKESTTTTTQSKEADTIEQPEKLDAKDQIEVNDPITSFTNWWGKEGSSKVNSLWGSITSNALKAEQSLNEYSAIDNLSKYIPELNIDKLDTENLNLNHLSLTLNNVINSVINTEELITVNVINDFHLSYLNNIIEKNFKKVINQVEGGIKIGIHNYEVVEDSRSLNVFRGKLSDGEKLAFANLDSSIKEFESKTKVEKEFKQSNLFIAIQPINHINSADTNNSNPDPEDLITIDSFNPNSFSFTIVLKDITHDLTIVTRSQSFPIKWLNWLEEDSAKDNNNVDPKEWVQDWIKDGLSLSFGVLAQSYVIKRMGY